MNNEKQAEDRKWKEGLEEQIRKLVANERERASRDEATIKELKDKIEILELKAEVDILKCENRVMDRVYKANDGFRNGISGLGDKIYGLEDKIMDRIYEGERIIKDRIHEVVMERYK